MIEGNKFTRDRLQNMETQAEHVQNTAWYLMNYYNVHADTKMVDFIKKATETMKGINNGLEKMKDGTFGG